MEGGIIFKINKRASTFIREMRVGLCTSPYHLETHAGVFRLSVEGKFDAYWGKVNSRNFMVSF